MTMSLEAGSLVHGPTFKALLRKPPYPDDLPDTTDPREKLPQDRDL
ncbi:hypothetical protein [Glycomyces sp. YM15]|nr:hypothetical protein [Glycomyces sp. YM15]